MAEGIFTVRISPEKQQQLDALAQALDRSRNWVVSEAIDQYLDTQAWQIDQIQHGIEEADRGELVPMKTLWRKLAPTSARPVTPNNA